jgi:hypothetical protein
MEVQCAISPFYGIHADIKLLLENVVNKIIETSVPESMP